MKTLTSGLALLLFAVPSYAQNASDTRWSRWTGCWELVTENSREGTPSPTPTRERRTQPADSGRPQVCVVASPDGGATFSTKVATQTPIVQTVVPDGKDRPITEDSCTGTQRAEWSSDGLHLYSRAELTCKEDKGTRRISGLAMIGPDGRWTDVQSVDIGGRESFRVRQYRRALGEPSLIPRTSASSLTLDDVKEASTKVSPRALEAALVETRASYSLSSKSLLDLSDAGVPASVIDLIVALSYPDRFVIERTASVDRAPAVLIDDPFGFGWGAFGFPVFSDFYGIYSPLYGAYSPYYYSPFAYPYLHGYNPYFGGGYAIDNGGGGGGGGVADRPSGLGRVVDGQGYTRVRPRDNDPASPRAGGDGSTASASGGSSSAPSSGGSSGGGSVTSQGFSSGGGGGGGSSDGGRSAQPR